MGIKTSMRGQSNLSVNGLFENERGYRGARLVEKWSRVPELGSGLRNLDEKAAVNLAIMLENQAKVMARLGEAQMSSMFQGLSPENMLRLVRLSYPNSIRGKVFTEFAMESPNDSIKYVRPVYTNSQTGESMSDRTFGDLNLDGDADFLGDDYRKAMYETTESRYSTELVNGLVDQTDHTVVVTFTNGAFGTNGANYLDGFSVVYLGSEKNPLAMQSRNGQWFYGVVANVDGFYYKITNVTVTNTYTFTMTLQVSADGVTWANYSGADLDIKTYGRFDSEGDLLGDHLGEVEIVMTDYKFKPRPQTLGVTWTQLTEIILDTGYGVSAEEILLDSASQEIKKALDFNAMKFGYANAKAYAPKNYVEFDAEAGAGIDDSYYHTAQLVSQAISRIGNLQLDEFNRGGVSVIVGGPSATDYLMLHKDFKTTGAQAAIGGHQIGVLGNIPVFKVPSHIIPNDELLTSWKNPANENDIAVAIGTLVPFWTSGAIQRKNLYKEAAIARFEDTHALQPRYLGRIKIKNIRNVGA
jgi:hypothetical protein